MQLPDLSLLLVMAIFWATYFVLRTFVFRPLGGILEGRELQVETAESALQKAIARQQEALAAIDRRLTEARREAMGLRESTRAAGATRRQAALEAAREKASQTVAAAQTRLDGEVAGAREQLRHDVAAIATELATGALGRQVA